MMAIGSMNKIKNPIAPKREPSLVILTNRDKTVTITITGRTPFTPPFTIFFPELVFPKSPRVSEPNKAGMNGYIDWNIYLNDKGGPNHVGNFCDAPVMCDTENDTIDIKLSYYYIGHFSRFVRRGAKRILVSRFTDKVEATFYYDCVLLILLRIFL